MEDEKGPIGETRTLQPSVQYRTGVVLKMIHGNLIPYFIEVVDIQSPTLFSQELLQFGR